MALEADRCQCGHSICGHMTWGDRGCLNCRCGEFVWDGKPPRRVSPKEKFEPEREG